MLHKLFLKLYILYILPLYNFCLIIDFTVVLHSTQQTYATIFTALLIFMFLFVYISK